MLWLGIQWFDKTTLWRKLCFPCFSFLPATHCSFRPPDQFPPLWSIHLWIICTYGEMLSLKFMHLPGSLLLFKVCTSLPSVCLCQSPLWLQWVLKPAFHGPGPSHTAAKPAIQQEVKCHHWGLTNYTLHFWKKKLSEWALGCASVLGQGEGKTGRNAPESKVTPVSHSVVSPCFNNRQRSQCRRQ